MSGIEDWNAANPCCCPEPLCEKAVFERETREIENRLCGFNPFTKTHPEEGEEPWPDAFDTFTNGVLWPQYKTKSTVSQFAYTGEDHRKSVRYCLILIGMMRELFLTACVCVKTQPQIPFMKEYIK